jgi:hypothetical protein
MHTLWMGVSPGPDLTRVLVQDGPRPILKARLPDAPQHPRALETLAGEIALWYGGPLYGALGVAAEDALCVSPRWHATVDGLTRTPLVTIDLVIGRPRPPRGGDGLGGLGEFGDVRQLRGRARGSRSHDPARAARADPPALLRRALASQHHRGATRGPSRHRPPRRGARALHSLLAAM